MWVLICAILVVLLILAYNLVVYYIAHFVFVRLWLVCLCQYELTSAYVHNVYSMCLGMCVHCVQSSFAQQSSYFLSGRQTGQGHCLRGVLEKCCSAVGEKKYERDPKSRRRAPWIMSAAELKKRDGTICSSIWMANGLTVLLTQAEEVWRGCED